MKAIVKKLMNHKRIIGGVKIVFCLLICTWLFSSFFVNGIDDYISYQDSFYQNDFLESVSGSGVTSIEQNFNAKGNILSNITLYIGETTDTEVSLEILDAARKVVSQKTINLKDYAANSWNRISLESDGLKRNGQYLLSVKGDDLASLVLAPTNAYSKVFTGCTADGEETGYTLAAGLQFTHQYMMLGDGLELAVGILMTAILAAALCFTVINFEKIFLDFRKSEKKKGVLYAIYFSVYTALLFNPLEAIRNEVTEFERVMGIGINAGVDVVKRIQNFNQWFLWFVLAFVLFFLLVNYLKNRKLSGENQKAVELLDNVIVIANVVQALRCILYFYNETQTAPIFYYSEYFIMLIIILIAAYIVLGFSKKISVERLEVMLVCGWLLVLPVSIVITHDWALGRVFMGLQVFVSAVIFFAVSFMKLDWNKSGISGSINTCAVFFSLIPLGTSFYIELVNILNQHEIFWINIRRNYVGAVCIGLILTAITAFIYINVKRKRNMMKWKSFSYPAIVFGFSCLWQQIPITSTYEADVFETANFSVLISDFLNFGDIPIVQHYGGHMMTGVWEGIIYALLNNDSVGASFSPYSEYIAAVIAVAFFLLIKHLWNEDAAILVVLFFPFYSSISYWGLGILTALAAMAYVRKNTYTRAALFWFACIWCAVYRLDLGYAFIIAGILALFAYIVKEKNLRAFKQLAVTLVIWGVIGLGAWCGICLAKDINPVSRLMEFLLINMSNQNWAYPHIGENNLARYAWTYIFIPFVSIICILCSVFSKRIRKTLGNGIWVMHLIIGFSYLFNFARGLVRHSLAEGDLMFPIWSAYLFIAIFIMAYVNRKAVMLPAFAGLILLNSLFTSGNNFSEDSIADAAAGKIGSYTETWTLSRFAEDETPDDEIPMTYWTTLREDGEVIERVQWEEDLVKTVQNYQSMIDVLLEDEETFVDCINRTSLYPLLERQNPVYVSQSPLQLSGEFTQEEFVKTMDGIPIVLMPYDPNNLRSSEALDAVPNLYRYYKVFEYIYQNYVPLCTFEDVYAIWCLPERYDEMAAKVRELMTTGTEIKDAIVSSDSIGRGSLETVKNTDGSVNLNFTGVDPMLVEIQNIMDLSPYVDEMMTIAIAYETDVLGQMQLLYTTEPEEGFNGDKIETIELTESSGEIYFKIPITEYTRMRLDIPERSNIKITSFKIGGCNCELAEYGYDGPYLAEDGVTYSYLSYVHNYDLNLLPVIWAESDTGESVNNTVITPLSYEDGVYRYSMDSSEYGADGNYLKVCMEYDGLDQSGNIDNDDETVDAVIKVGKMEDGQFVTKYVYSFEAKEGQHDYMFRISNDYYWYTDDTDAVVLECSELLHNVNMSILEGD